MKCYECKWLDRSIVLTSSPPQYRCTLGFGSHYADHECEYDFMPIVRCKDCKWHKLTDNNETEICTNKQWDISMAVYPIISADDYCSYGERREE